MGNAEQQSPRVTTHDYIMLGTFSFFFIAFLAIYIWLMWGSWWRKMRSRGDIESNYPAPGSNDAFRNHILSRQLMYALRAPAAAGLSSTQPVPRERAFPAPAAAGLSSAQLMVLGSFKYRKSVHESEVECSICLSVMADDEEVRRLPKCNHYFHKGCIDAWLSLKPTCPLCVTRVVVRAAPQEQRQQNRIIFGPRQLQQPEQNVGLIAIVRQQQEPERNVQIFTIVSAQLS